MSLRGFSRRWPRLRVLLALLAVAGLQLGAVRAALGLGCPRAPDGAPQHGIVVAGELTAWATAVPAAAVRPATSAGAPDSAPPVAHAPAVERCAPGVAVLPAVAELPRAALLPRGPAAYDGAGGPPPRYLPSPPVRPPRLI